MLRPGTLSFKISFNIHTTCIAFVYTGNVRPQREDIVTAINEEREIEEQPKLTPGKYTEYIKIK